MTFLGVQDGWRIIMAHSFRSVKLYGNGDSAHGKVVQYISELVLTGRIVPRLALDRPPRDSVL